MLRWLPTLRDALTRVRTHDGRLSRVHVALVVAALVGAAWRPLLRKWLVRLHYRATAEPPRLHFQPTTANTMLLATCPTLSAF
jgi:hypothetical protein